MYTSSFAPSPQAEQVMRSGNILAPGEQPSAMIERVVATAFAAEVSFGYEPSDTAFAARAFGELCDSGAVVMSTPVLTNAGRYADKPLTACTMPPVDLRGDLRKVKQTVDTMHQQGMGTGFNLTETDDPVSMLRYLNDVAVEGASSGKEDRPVGNMAIISVRHPRIREFVDAKRGSGSDGSSWKFNISVNMDSEFMDALEADGSITLMDGSRVQAASIFSQICSAARDCADPGLIFLDRMNDRNPTPGIGQYQTTAPCAEVGLAPGETCQFGYINLGKFVGSDANGPRIDYDRLSDTAHIMTRVLDNSLQLSIDQYTTPESTSIMTLKRKIGVGICGVADMLATAGIPYDSPEAVKLTQDAIAWVNYQTKLASIQLAAKRGPAGAMPLLNLDPELPTNRHTHGNGLVHRLFGEVDTAMVSGQDWQDLSQVIRTTRQLRNVTTTALPPTGRSSLVIDASTGVEPYFTVTDRQGEFLGPVDAYLSGRSIKPERMHVLLGGEVAASDNEAMAMRVLKQATAISPVAHLAMAGGVQQVIDEAVAKTVNMPEASTACDIETIYHRAWVLGMSGITVYRQNTHSLQPRKL